MLRSLQIKNYALIDSLDIEFPAGLIIITGQTGAGKSIILGALSLVLGARSDTSMVGSSGDNCVVEAEFSVEGDEAVQAIIEENGLDWNGGILVIRRVMSKSGRSRSFVNDEPVNVRLLGEISDRLLDIHSQHATILLKDRQFQLSILDHYAGNSDLLEQCRQSYKSLVSAEKQLNEVSLRLDEAVKEKDYNRSRLDRLEAAGLKEGELEELEAEQKRLSNAEDIKESLFQAAACLSDQGREDVRELDTVLKEAVRLLSKTGTYIPEASVLADRVESARIDINDIKEEILKIESSVDVSAGTLEKVEERLSLLYDLLKIYSCGNVQELLAMKNELSENLLDTERIEEQKKMLEVRVGEHRKKLCSICEALHESRKGHLIDFENVVGNSIRNLELEKAVFEVRLTETEVSATGKDEVTFLFSASGNSPIEVSKCASGGEMSRIMLCLKAMLAKYTNMPSMVFDEIDTGVSGSVADKMGSMICAMGEDMQVFAITHLPQVAAKGDAHYLVTKEIEGEAPRTDIRKIEGEDRIMEIARMLSGSTITPEAVANARSFVGNNFK